MFWRVECEEVAARNETGAERWDGRFVLHRHHDGDGPHLDLRLEYADCLAGWRIDGGTLEGEPWATEKGPHPVHWLDHDGDAVREDAGTYAWIERDADRGVLVLQGRAKAFRLRMSRVRGLAPGTARAVCEALGACGANDVDAGRLILDGVSARQIAVERLCGLGRELDGAVFDEAVWRKTLRGLSLDEIHRQLHAYEVRFDRKYPPQSVSRPERLPEDKEEGRAGAAMAILRG